VNIVGQWRDAGLDLPPMPNETIQPGTILVAVGPPESIKRLRDTARPITGEGVIVVVGFGDVGQKLREILTAVGERVCVVGDEERPGVDVVGDVTDPAVLDRLPLPEARVAILALEPDAATIFAATILRDRDPDLPILAGVGSAENVPRIQRAGADYALSLGQVAGNLLAHHVLGETVSLQPRIKLVRVTAGPLTGRNPLAERVRERTGCTVVAAERNGEVIMDLPASFRLIAEDAVYICGSAEAIGRYDEEFPATWL